MEGSVAVCVQLNGLEDAQRCGNVGVVCEDDDGALFVV